MITDEEYMKIQEGRSATGSYREMSPWAVQFMRDYSKYLRSPILEIGCGNGAILEYLKDNGYFAMGLDISRPSVFYCLNHIKPVSAVHFDADKGLPFPDNSFRTVLSFHTFEHHRNPEFVVSEIDRILNGHACILAPGGDGDINYGHFGKYDFNGLKKYFEKFDKITESNNYVNSLLLILKTGDRNSGD